MEIVERSALFFYSVFMFLEILSLGVLDFVL